MANMNSCDYRVFWDETVNQLREQIGINETAMWFSRITYEKSYNDVIVLSVPSGFIRDQIRQRYEVIIEKKLFELFGGPLKLEFEIKAAPIVQDYLPSSQNESSLSDRYSVQKQPPHLTYAVESAQPNRQSETSNASHTMAESTVQSTVKPPHPDLNDRYTFESFVVDNENPFPANAALAASKNPGTAYNPLLIYGGVGLGKTHLMQAIGNAVYKTTNLKILYTTAEDFTNEFISFLNKQKMHEFKNKYRSADMLLIDDIHFFEKKDATQEELFHTFNTLYESNKQIVFTCDRPVQELKNLTDRLRSRFTRGLSIDLKIPTYETRCAILFKKIEADNLSIPQEVVEMLAKNISSNVRDLEGALTKLRAYSELAGPITVETARRLMQDTFGSPRQHNISIDNIQKIVADYFNISFADIKGKKRTKNISFPRQVAMYLSREMTEFSTTEIGVEFGGRDHTTIMHGHQKIETQVAVEPSLEVTIAELKKRITHAVK